MSTREQNKEIRRKEILAAAERLIYRTQSTDFSMNELAGEAGTSMKTTYNLIGSKSKVLYTLLSASLDKIEAHPMAKAQNTNVRSIIDMAELPIGVFTGLPSFYRPLLRFLLGTADSTERPAFMARAYHFWLSGLSEFKGGIGLRCSASTLALHLHTYFAGALDLWVQDEIDAEEFRRHLRCAVAMSLLPHVGKENIPMLLAHIEQFEDVAQSYEIAMVRYTNANKVTA